MSTTGRPDRDYMQDADVTTIEDAFAKMDTEVREEYRRAGEPHGFLAPGALLEWAEEQCGGSGAADER